MLVEICVACTVMCGLILGLGVITIKFQTEGFNLISMTLNFLLVIAEIVTVLLSNVCLLYFAQRHIG